MVQRKFNPEEIDEDFLISTIQNGKQVSEHNEKKAVKRQTTEKNETVSDYMSLFLRQTDNKSRFGKQVPIRQKYHERIQKIVRVIANDEISILNYIDNVLSRHFEEFQEEIVKLYHEKNKDIF